MEILFLFAIDQTESPAATVYVPFDVVVVVRAVLVVLVVLVVVELPETDNVWPG